MKVTKSIVIDENELNKILKAYLEAIKVEKDKYDVKDLKITLKNGDSETKPCYTGIKLTWESEID